MTHLKIDNRYRLRRAVDLLVQAARELYKIGEEEYVATGEQIDAMIAGLERRTCTCTPIAADGKVYHHADCLASKVGTP